MVPPGTRRTVLKSPGLLAREHEYGVGLWPRQPTAACAARATGKKKPGYENRAFNNGCLTMSYFRTGNPHYHRR
jgi:hypothetical protein